MPFTALEPPSARPRGQKMLRPADFLVRLGLEAPDRAVAGEDVRDARGNPDPHPAVVFAGFQQQHAVLPRCGQPIGQHAAGGAGADDDVVEFRFGHGCVFPFTSMLGSCWISTTYPGRPCIHEHQRKQPIAAHFE